MSADLPSRGVEPAGEMAVKAKTAENLNDLIRLIMKPGLKRMLNTEMEVHLGRRNVLAADPPLESRHPEQSTGGRLALVANRFRYPLPRC